LFQVLIQESPYLNLLLETALVCYLNQIPHARLKHLNNKPAQRSGEFILYWCQSSHRVQENWTFAYAVETANQLDLPLVVYFGLTPQFPEGNLRHYWFMLEGLKETADGLEKLGVKFLVKITDPARSAVKLSKQATLVVVDKGYLRINREWYQNAAEKMQVPLVQVEDNVVVPVEEASQKEEYSAATLRRKLQGKIAQFLALPPKAVPKHASVDLPIESIPLNDLNAVISELKIDRTVPVSERFHGGTKQAKELLQTFIEQDLWIYDGKGGATPDNDCASQLSPYLHFGQISPSYIANEVLEAKASASHRFLEELIVRRELSVNFVYYNKNYDSIRCLPDWAQKTLTDHVSDPRPITYNKEELENAQTHDAYWNAAQKEMVEQGKMNGYMRMYWGKKILEWTHSPEKAFEVALYLNNKYEVDGRDPNGYAGVAWCFGKHDKPWAERAVFGKVRYMNLAGLERKFKMELYLKKVNHSI
jgi:deoxyribodipyrimidine photo-lyase